MAAHGHDAKTFQVRKHADKSGRRLPDGAYPSTGYSITGSVHDEAMVPVNAMEKWERDGFAVLENKSTVTYPGGPENDPYRRANLHVCTKCDFVVLKCRDGKEYRYEVLQSPGKYYSVDELPVSDDMTRYCKEDSHMDHFYLLRKV